ncbi:MAG: signal peptidase I [Bacteroidota bacterium]
MHKEKKKNKKPNKPLKKWIKAVLFAFIIALFIRGFVTESHKFNTGNFGNTLQSGDYILINKLRFGARCPITLISLPFFKNIYSDIIQLPYFRLPGFDKLSPNDLIVFNSPEENDPPVDKKTLLIKRIAGCPGDTVFIDNKTVFINGQDNDTDKKHLLFKYRIITDGTEITDEQKNKYKLSEGEMIADMGIYDFSMNPNIYDSLLNEKNISNLRVLKDFQGENIWEIFPKCAFHKWNKDYFGPVIIPYKGLNVQIDIKNVQLYKKIIDVYEENDFYTELDKVFINGQEASEYTIKKDYYFVLDDNRDYAKDSRYWGFLPEDHIIGTASLIWFNMDKWKISWNRVLKKL